MNFHHKSCDGDTPLLLLSTHVRPTAAAPTFAKICNNIKSLQFTQTIFEKSKGYKVFSMTYWHI